MASKAPRRSPRFTNHDLLTRGVSREGPQTVPPPVIEDQRNRLGQALAIGAPWLTIRRLSGGAKCRPLQARVRPPAVPELARSGCSVHVPFSPSRQAIASSSTRIASSTGITGRAWNSNAGSIEQNL